MKYSTVNFLHVSKFTAPDDDVAVTLLYARREFVAEVGEGRRCCRSEVAPGDGISPVAKSLCKDTLAWKLSNRRTPCRLVCTTRRGRSIVQRSYGTS